MRTKDIKNQIMKDKKINSTPTCFDENLFKNTFISKGPQLKELLLNQFVSKIHWLPVICSLITTFFWWTKVQLNLITRILASFVCNLILYLLISFFLNFKFDYLKRESIKKNYLDSESKTNLKDSFDEERLLNGIVGYDLKNKKYREWFNRLLNEIWPRICSSYKMNNLQKGISIGRCLFLNKFNLTQTQTPNIEKINLINKIETSNGQVIILDLIVQIDWSTIDNENLVSLSIYNLQFTISNLHSISTKLKLRIAIYYLNNRTSGHGPYKINLTLLEQPIIKNYEISGAVYLLCFFFNFHLLLINWIIDYFIIFPRTFVFILDSNIFNLNFLTNQLKNDSFIDLDLDDLKCLSILNGRIDFLDNLAQIDIHQINNETTKPNELINDIKFKKLTENKQNQLNKNEFNKIKIFKNAYTKFLKNKIANHIVHISVMNAFNVPLPKGLSSFSNLSYFVRIKIGDYKFITNAHIIQDSSLYWLQSFILATNHLNLPIHIEILAEQNQTNYEIQLDRNQENKKSSDPMNSFMNLESINTEMQPINDQKIDSKKVQLNLKLKECFKIKLTDNLIDFLNLNNLNGKLYTVEDEFNKSRLIIRFTIFDLKMQNHKQLKYNQIDQTKIKFNDENIINKISMIGLPVGVLSLFISHITGVQFISDSIEKNLEQSFKLAVMSISQCHVFQGQNIGKKQNFKQNCFFLIFNPDIEQIQFKIYFSDHKIPKKATISQADLTNSQSTETDITNNTNLINKTAIKTSKDSYSNKPIAFRPDYQSLANQSNEFLLDSTKHKTNTHSLASCSFKIEFISKTIPQFDKIKLDGCFKDCHLHIYHCYSLVKDLNRIERIIQDSENTFHTYMTPKNIIR